MTAGPLLRPMAVPRACKGVARVRSACFPAWPVSGDQIADTEARRPRDRLHLAWAAVQQDEIAAYGYVEEPDIAARPGRIPIRVASFEVRCRKDVR